MKAVFFLCLCLFSLTAFAENKITFFAKLSPAGSFEGVSQKAKGNIIKDGDTVTSDKITVNVESFKTENEQRDEHLWKHLNSTKNPKIILSDVKGSGGKATGTIEINGVKQPVNITYKIVGQEVEANFSVNYQKFGMPKAQFLLVSVEDEIKVEVKHQYKNK